MSYIFPENSNLEKTRIFVSTKKNILNDVEKGLFREDLYYRLNVVPIKLPSLKDRFEDISEKISSITILLYSWFLILSFTIFVNQSFEKIQRSGR